MWSELSQFAADCWGALGQLTLSDILANKIARAIGMFGLVLLTIWVIALVYSGYAQDSVLGPIAIRPHTNRRLGESAVVFDQSKYPFQMDGVEATCQVFYQYEDAAGKTRRIPVLGPRELKMHIRVSTIPADDATHYGFETKEDIGSLPHTSVTFPTFETQVIPKLIGPTPPTVREYIEQNGLEALWREDDEAPVISLGAAQVDLIAEARKAHISARAKNWMDSQRPGLLNGISRARATRERANVFGSYYIRMQFSKRPDFVLFRHPNRELKMTAWLTLLTSLFSLAMDLWPVERVGRSTPTTPQFERPTPSTTPSLPRPRPGR